MPENRKRNKTISIRLTKSERQALYTKANKAEMSLTDYILSLNNSVNIYPPPDLSPLLKELKRIGINLNQLATKANSGATYIPGLHEVLEMQRKIYAQLTALMESTAWQR